MCNLRIFSMCFISVWACRLVAYGGAHAFYVIFVHIFFPSWFSGSPAHVFKHFYALRRASAQLVYVIAKFAETNSKSLSSRSASAANCPRGNWCRREPGRATKQTRGSASVKKRSACHRQMLPWLQSALTGACALRAPPPPTHQNHGAGRSHHEWRMSNVQNPQK